MVKGLAFCLSHHLTDRGGLRRGGSRPLDSFPWHATAFGAPEKGDGDGREFYPRNPIFDSENAWYFWMLSNSENIYMKNYETVLHTCPLYFIILKGTSMNITPFPDGSQMETTVETSPRLSSGLTLPAAESSLMPKVLGGQVASGILVEIWRTVTRKTMGKPWCFR